MAFASNLCMPHIQFTGRKRDSARLDILTSILTASHYADLSETQSGSPCDSLDPLDEWTKHSSKVWKSDSESVATRTYQTQQPPHLAFQHFDSPHDTSPVSASTTEACSPRSPHITRRTRPSNLKLHRTNGLTTLSAQDLKSRTWDANARDGGKSPNLNDDHRSQPAAGHEMGNQQSTTAGAPEADSASVRSVVRRPVRILRKSSTNLFKRLDSRTPLPTDLTATVLQVQQQRSTSTLDGANDSHELDREDPFVDRDEGALEPDARGPRSGSTVTVTEVGHGQPLSAATTIRAAPSEHRAESRGDSVFEETARESNPTHTQPPEAVRLRNAALSPSIPAPSPIPEDTPHKYGLKDRSDTPDLPEPEEIDVVKVRRRSNGLEIFNEAKSLQSASSFLNGLSTSRRRAESGTRETSTSNRWPISASRTSSYDTTRPYSSTQFQIQGKNRSHTPTTNTNTYSTERCRGHNFKPSGFAYSRPLTLNQLKCYRSHVNLLPSGNRKAPVECSVCHINDEREHFSCAWCALRMCRFCRTDFRERGVGALRDRIRLAEMGGEKDGSTEESLAAGSVVTPGRQRNSCMY